MEGIGKLLILRNHRAMHIKQTHIPITLPNLLKEHVSPTHGVTEGIKHENTTHGIKHWGLSGYSNFLPRIKFGVTGQVSSPQSPTISYRHPSDCLKTHNQLLITNSDNFMLHA